MYEWSPSIHVLLQHLEAVDFPYAPRFLGIDEQGREILSYCEGIAGADGSAGPGFGAHVWAMVVPDDGLARFAHLLREYHDAIRDFAAPSEAPWASAPDEAHPENVICHNDFGPWNIVWRDGSPICIIDWDYASPAPPLHDVAFALEWSVPFASDDECLTWRRFDKPPNRIHRIEVFADAYGLTSTDGIVDAVIARQRAFRATVLDHAARGIPESVDEVESGYLDTVDARIEWTKQHRHLLEA
jgi:hypothetical protein